MKSRVLFTKTVSPEAVLKIYKALGVQLDGRVAVKVHSGEVGNQNFLRPQFWSDIMREVGGTVVECNTAYEGGRNTTARHVKTLKLHGWSDAYDFEILDSEAPDLELDIPDGKRRKKNYVGRGITKYDSILVLSHFKGHPSGGYGGAIKQLSIGFASSYGKAYIHGVGKPDEFWTANHDDFLRSMADAASTVSKMFEGKAVYINVMANMSVDCDCCAKAKDPCMSDIGILASCDPVAIDRACLDLVYSSTDPGRDTLVERIESRNGVLTLNSAYELGLGSLDYELEEITV